MLPSASVPPVLTALELFSGIGGFAAAVAGSNVRVVTACDQSPAANNVYRRNFPEHAVRQNDLEQLTADDLAGMAADLWWLSPPCQPYSVRGRGHDLDDPRARSLVNILKVVSSLPDYNLPNFLALENVPGFAGSRARSLLVGLLNKAGYQIRERLLCPTELGVPSRRPRYYLVASRDGLAPVRTPSCRPVPLRTFLVPEFDADPPAALMVAPEVIARFGEGLRILDPDDPAAYTTCFTAGYGKSLMHAGSYLRCRTGVRRFAPEELARLLHFPAGFAFPDDMPLRKRWQLLGNSLSVAAVKEVLEALPGSCRETAADNHLCTDCSCHGGFST